MMQMMPPMYIMYNLMLKQEGLLLAQLAFVIWKNK